MSRPVDERTMTTSEDADRDARQLTALRAVTDLLARLETLSDAQLAAITQQIRRLLEGLDDRD